MALNLSGFVTEEQDFGFLHKAADKIERKQYREDQLNEQRTAKRAATGKFLEGYLSPKDHLTGTNYDPMIVKGFNDLLAEGAGLAQKGADTNTLLMALAPKVNQLSQYSVKAKALDQRLKTQLSKIKPGMGYDIPRLEQESRKQAFYNEDGKLKDINEVNVDADYVTEVIAKKPGLVTTDAGIDEFVKNSPKFTNSKSLTTYTPTGGMTKKKVKITAPNWLTEDIDEKGAFRMMVPKFQLALEDGQPQMHEFTKKDGKKVQEPVRLLDEGEFKSIMSGNPGIADWVRGQVMEANPGIDLNSTQAKNAARGILYSELKRKMPGSVEDDGVIDKPSSYEIKMNLGIPLTRSGKGVDDVQTNNPWTRIRDAVREGNSRGQTFLPAQLLQRDEVDVVMNAVRGTMTDKQAAKAVISDYKIIEGNDGSLRIFDSATDDFVAFVGKESAELKNQPGVKEKREKQGELNREREQPKPKDDLRKKYNY